MSAANEQQLIQQAAEWFAVLRDEAATDADRARWRDWLADPTHARAWQRVEAISQPFERVGPRLADPARRTLEHARGASRRRALRLLGAAGILFGTAYVARQQLPWRDWAYDVTLARAQVRTRVGEIHELDLPDGSRLTLNTASALDLDFSDSLRRIALREGELYVATAPDVRTPPRAFVVDTAHGRLTALGTRFSVRGMRAAIDVAVFEGAVRIAPADGGASVDLPAGRAARFNRAGVESIHAADPARASWSRGLLIADNQRLDTFVAELARYTEAPLEVAPEAAALRLVGVYRIARPRTDVPAALLALEDALPVRLETLAGGGVRLLPRAAR